MNNIHLDKQYLLSGNRLKIRVKVTNTRLTALSWDIWSNARFEGDTRFFVPFCREANLRINYSSNGPERIDYTMQDGNFWFTKGTADEETLNAKAFIHPEQGTIVANRHHQLLIIEFASEDAGKIHPEQALVEIYLRRTPGGEEDLLELEHHSAYRELNPGESMTLSETWTLLPYDGEETTEHLIDHYMNNIYKDQ